MPTIVILVVGSDQSLLGTQRLILQSAGYSVVSTPSIIEAINRFLSGDFDLVILGHCIPTKDRDRLTCLIRASG
jgi:DNA-binding response OmpR family regulator